MIRSFLLIACFLCAVTVTAQNKIPLSKLDKQRDGNFWQRGGMKPFSGTAFEDWPNKKKKVRSVFKNGKLNGKSETWYKNGKKQSEMNFDAGKQIGTEKQWYENGKLRLQINYANGAAHGMLKEFYENGNLKSQGNYIYGKEDGEHKWFFDDGKVDQLVFYINGKADGEVKQWYPNGNMKALSNFRQGQKEGETKKWYPTGEIQTTEQYSNGKPNGKFSLLDKEGYLKELRVYQIGDLMEEHIYRSGRVIVDDGFAMVYNEKDNHYKVNIEGAWVRELDHESSLYLVEGVFIQVINSKIPATAETEELKILAAGVEAEKLSIETETKRTITINSENKRNKAGENYIHWKFDADKKENTQAKTEHYITFIANGIIVHLYAIQPQRISDETTSALLQKIADSFKSSEEPIDMNEIN